MVKVAILVDGMYLEHAAKAFRFEKVDVSKLPSILLKHDGTEDLFRIYIFDALPYVPKHNPTQKQKENRKKKYNYFQAIRYKDRVCVETGDVRPKTSTCPSCKKKIQIPVQKLVDVKMSVRLVALGMANTVDIIVLFSGDKDICPAVEEINHAGSGVNVRLAYVIEGNVKTSKELIKTCPETIRITKDQLLSCRFEKV